MKFCSFLWKICWIVFEKWNTVTKLTCYLKCILSKIESTGFYRKRCVSKTVLFTHVHAEVWSKSLEFSQSKHLALSVSRRVSACRSLKQQTLQVYTTFFSPPFLFCSFLNLRAYLGARVFLQTLGAPGRRDLPPQHPFT